MIQRLQLAGFGSTAATLFFGTFVAWVFNHNLPFLRQMRAIITMPLFAAPIAVAGWAW